MPSPGLPQVDSEPIFPRYWWLKRILLAFALFLVIDQGGAYTFRESGAVDWDGLDTPFFLNGDRADVEKQPMDDWSDMHGQPATDNNHHPDGQME